MSHYARRRDANHGTLTAIYEAHGWLVEDLSHAGKSVADTLMLTPNGDLRLREFKVKDNKVTHKKNAGQVEKARIWPVRFISSEAEALLDIQAERTHVIRRR